MKVANTPMQINWKQVAIQKQQRLETGAKGETLKEMADIQIDVYSKQAKKIETLGKLFGTPGSLFDLINL